MIIAKLIGGLGNQMFQYAAGRSLAQARNTELKLDLSFLQAETGGSYTKREYELSVFNITPAFATETETASLKKSFNNRYSRALYRKMPFLFSSAYIAERGSQFHKEFFTYPKDTFLEGFWQSEDYFLGIEDIIRHDFSFKEPLSGKNLELAQKIQGTNSVSLHIRRGDYVTNQNAFNFHGICAPEYYKAGVAKIREKTGNMELFIFSDDADWCRKNLVFDQPATHVDHNSGPKSCEDMRLMSLCKHNIIANSSFSWWGAWLNANKQKIVIAPEKWFNDPSKQSDAIYPKTWIKL